MGESPSLLLQRAAERLTELASNATKGPWEASGYELYADDGEVIVSIDYDGGGFSSMNNGLWCAAMSPAVAEPIAAMLRWDADRLKWAARCEDVDKSYRGFELARLILGEAPSE